MKRGFYITLIFCCAFNTKAQQNLILNGSFEFNNVTGIICEDEISKNTYNSLRFMII